jgi:hypothetical protein
MKKQTAFTLIEFIIFIGIMIFLLSFIWENQLPHKILMAAKINSLENDYHLIMAATYNYLDKYRVLPGDLNNNGKIEGDFDSIKAGDESRLFWLQLRQAGLIKGESTDQKQPVNAFGGVIGVATGAAVGEYHGIPGLFIGFSHIPGEVAFILDSRNDDANPSLGYIQAHQIISGKEIHTENYSVEGLYNLYFAM